MLVIYIPLSYNDWYYDFKSPTLSCSGNVYLCTIYTWRYQLTLPIKVCISIDSLTVTLQSRLLLIFFSRLLLHVDQSPYKFDAENIGKRYHRYMIKGWQFDLNLSLKVISKLFNYLTFTFITSYLLNLFLFDLFV